MSTINAVNLELQLVQKINSTTNEFDLLALSTALRQLRSGAVFVVQQFVNLPSAAANAGQLFFVVEDNATYVSALNLFGVLSWQLLSSDSLNVAFTWGEASSGTLGESTTVNRSSPGTLSGGGNTWCQIRAGYRLTAAVKTDGTAWTWGLNNVGQLGDGTVVARSSPVTTAGGGTNWCAICPGPFHIAAVKTDGTMWTWGRNCEVAAGQGWLGTNYLTSFSSPRNFVTGNLWCTATAGRRHTVGIRTDGTLWTWGMNSFGGLGTGNTTYRFTPGTTVGGGTTWCATGAHQYHTTAIKTDGTAWTWGYNGQGRLGDGTTVARSSPGTVAGGGTTWCNISAGSGITAAVKTDGTLWTWGSNFCGQLGTGTTVSRTSPGTVAGGGTTWCGISAGCAHTTAVKTDGTAWTWGCNNYGQLGHNTVVATSSPVTTVGGGSSWCQISAGSGHTAAIASRTL